MCKRFYIYSLTLLISLISLFAGCDKQQSLLHSESEASKQSAGMEYEIEASSPSADADLIVQENQDAASKEQEISVLLAKMKEAHIPADYLDSIAEYTKITETEYYRTGYLENELDILQITSKNYEATLLRLGIPTAPHYMPQYHEYHIFFNGKRVGMMANWINGGDEYAIREFEDYAWLTAVNHDTGRVGSQSYKATEQWYMVSDGSFREDLQFTARNYAGVGWFSVPQMAYDVDYTAKVTEIGKSEYGIFLSLEWDEKIFHNDDKLYGFDDSDIMLHGKGTVDYDYRDSFTRSNHYYKDNSIYELPETTHGRGMHDILITYLDEISDITRNGSNQQKKWLHEFLGYTIDWNKIGEVYQWYENEV